SVAGTWSGSLLFTVSTGPVAQPVTMTLTQSRDTVSGTWQTHGGLTSKTGLVGGTASANSFAGTFTITITNLATGGACNGTLAVPGRAGGTVLTWTSPGIAGNCTIDPPTNLTFTVVRQ